MNSSRDIVLDAVDFRGPARLPLEKGDDPDIAWVGYSPAADFEAAPGVDEWGCRWESLNREKGDKGQVVEHPLADWAGFDDWSAPDPYATGRIEHMPSSIAKARKNGKFIFGNLGAGPMHLLDYLRGFQNFLMDLVLERERIEALLDQIFAFLEGITIQYAKQKIDAVHLVDDQAMQSGPLFSMEIWRELFKPRYAALFDLAHSYGLKVRLHACGNLSQHLVDLADAGVDIVDNKQPDLWMDCPAVDEVRGRVAFSSCIDIQSRMQHLEIDEIEPEVDRLLCRLATPDGGFIGTCYHQPDLGFSCELTEAMLDAFRNFDWNGSK